MVSALALAVEPPEAHRPPFNPKESIFARGLGSYMVCIGIILATIVMMEIVFISAMTLGLSLSPGRPWCLPPSVWRRWVTPSRSLRYSAHTGDEFFLQPLLLAAVTVTSLLQLAQFIWSHCNASLAPTGFHHCNWQFVFQCLDICLD